VRDGKRGRQTWSCATWLQREPGACSAVTALPAVEQLRREVAGAGSGVTDSTAPASGRSEHPRRLWVTVGSRGAERPKRL